MVDQSSNGSGLSTPAGWWPLIALKSPSVALMGGQRWLLATRKLRECVYMHAHIHK